MNTEWSEVGQYFWLSLVKLHWNSSTVVPEGHWECAESQGHFIVRPCSEWTVDSWISKRKWWKHGKWTGRSRVQGMLLWKNGTWTEFFFFSLHPSVFMHIFIVSMKKGKLKKKTADICLRWKRWCYNKNEVTKCNGNVERMNKSWRTSSMEPLKQTKTDHETFLKVINEKKQQHIVSMLSASFSFF